MSGLSPLTYEDWVYLALIMEGFFFGIYSGIFAMYLQYQASKKCADKKTTVIFYSLCTLYVLSVAFIALDIARTPLILLSADSDGMLVYTVIIIPIIISGCCDFIGQSILIYRCWIVWNRNIRVVIIPSILALAFLVIWLGYCGSVVYNTSQHQFEQFGWGKILTLISVAMSLAVNALVTGLIVFKIFKVYCEVKPFYAQSFGASGGSKLRPVIFILIESGMALFCIQVARLVVTFVWAQAGTNAAQPIISIYEMFNGVTPTIIQVRVVMGLSFHEENSLVEATSSLRFGPDHPNVIPETGNGIHQERRDNDQDCKDNEVDDQQGDTSDIAEVYREEHISCP